VNADERASFLESDYRSQFHHLRVAPGAKRRGFLTDLQTALGFSASLPGARQLKTDACLLDDFKEARARAVRVDFEARRQVLSEADVMRGVFERLRKVQQVDCASHCITTVLLWSQ
jgi:hypothetical protein